MGRRASERRCRRAVGRGARTFPAGWAAAAAPGSAGAPRRSWTSERCLGRRAPDNARGGPVTPAGNAERPGCRHPAAAARSCRPCHARPGGGRDRPSRPSDRAGRLRRRGRLLFGAIKANEPRASAERSQLNRLGWFATWARCTRRPDTRWVRAAGRGLAGRWGIPRVAPCAPSCVFGPEGRGEPSEIGAPRREPPARHHPQPPAWWPSEGVRRGNWVVAIFLLLSLKPLEAAPSRLRSPRRDSSRGGGERWRRRDSAPGRGGRPRRRRCWAGCGSEVRGAGPSRRGPPGRASERKNEPRGWLLPPSFPCLTAARRHGAGTPDGPVSIPGEEGVGAARGSLGARLWPGRGVGLEPSGSGAQREGCGREYAEARDHLETSPCLGCWAWGGLREESLIALCLRARWPPQLPANAAWYVFSVSLLRLWCGLIKYFIVVLQAPHQPAQPFKFTISESCDRIKEEFQFLQAQYHR